MPAITLPDGSVRQFDAPVTGTTVAEAIGPGLARAALAMKVDGKAVDISTAIDQDAHVVFITRRDVDALEMIRHDAAHVLAEAVQELFPGTQVTIGPSIENGFYYDFARNDPFTPEDFGPIEAKMREIVARGARFERQVMDREEAIAFFQAKGEKYKAQLIEDLPRSEVITLYRQGEWIDLCRGPHLRTTADIGTAFKLMKVAGAYWRGDSKNEMLQRIYGTAWATKEEQDAYLKMLEEADKRDHRRLGTQLDLFHIEEAAPGMVFWHPKGWILWQQVEQYMRRVYRENGYQEVRGPMVLPRSLWETTGHWENYRENMFVTESEKRDYALKPMNCPGHILIFNKGTKSYRDLPLRFGEFGSCHRNEPSGALHGLMRARGFTQDDGHIFCTEEQILPECVTYTALLQKVYAHFGFSDIIYKVATRPEKRIGSDEAWDKSEQALIESLRRSGVAFEISPGEGAFYGPKIEYSLKDAIGRVWQCGTMQVDFNLTARLGAEYVAADNTRRTPVMLHRATIGSMERFLGILIEHFGGAFPLWLAPEQVVVLNVSEHQAEYAESVAKALREAGFRAVADLRNEKISYKIREHSLQKLPYQVVVGDKEKQAGSVAVRTRSGEDLGPMALGDFVRRLGTEAGA